MAASSKHHVRNRILGGLGAVILEIRQEICLTGVSFARQMAESIMLIRMITILSM